MLTGLCRPFKIHLRSKLNHLIRWFDTTVYKHERCNNMEQKFEKNKNIFSVLAMTYSKRPIQRYFRFRRSGVGTDLRLERPHFPCNNKATSLPNLAVTDCLPHTEYYRHFISLCQLNPPLEIVLMQTRFNILNPANILNMPPKYCTEKMHCYHLQ